MDPWTHSQNILKETKEGCNFCNEEYKKSTAQDTFGRIETVPGGFIKIACSWSSLVEGDEQPDSPNGQICVECCIVYAEQCDQMLKYKRAQKDNIHLGYFCKKICNQELSKIAHSGHTAIHFLVFHNQNNLPLEPILLFISLY